MILRLWNRARRKALGLSQGSLGAAFNMAASQVCSYELDRAACPNNMDVIVTNALDELSKAYAEEVDPIRFGIYELRAWSFYYEERAKYGPIDRCEKNMILRGLKNAAKRLTSVSVK